MTKERTQCLGGTAVIEFFSSIRIDMIHHQVDVLLSKGAKIHAFWEDSSDKFMI